MKIEYQYGTDAAANNERIFKDLTYDEKFNAIMYYCDYKTSRRTVNYNEFMLRELAKDS
jgi:hypothetical protein